MVRNVLIAVYIIVVLAISTMSRANAVKSSQDRTAVTAEVQ